LVGGLLALFAALLAGYLYAGRALVPIRASIDRRQAALQRQREFAANASHELRTPLTVIGTSVEDLKRNRRARVEDVGEALGDIRTLSGQTDRKDEGVQLLQSLADRIDRVKIAVRSGERPKVLAIEWLDPLMTAGHWVPQLIDLAGGQDVLGLAGEHSEVVPWELARAAAPEVVIVMPCGRDAEASEAEAELFIEQLTQLGAKEVVAVDASAYFSRPGPRLVHGLELLASILHPTSGIEPPEDAAYWIVGSPRPPAYPASLNSFRAICGSRPRPAQTVFSLWPYGLYSTELFALHGEWLLRLLVRAGR